MKGFFQEEDLFSEEYRQLCEFVVKNFPPVLKKEINIEETNLEGIDSKDVNLEDVSLEVLLPTWTTFSSTPALAQGV